MCLTETEQPCSNHVGCVTSYTRVLQQQDAFLAVVGQQMMAQDDSLVRRPHQGLGIVSAL
jgi:hypothetical protein